MKNTTITLIGAGNMGAALLSGLIANGLSPQQLWITDPDAEKLNSLQNQFGIYTTPNNEEAVKMADVVILAVKPQMIPNIAQQLAATIQSHQPLVISIAAGITESNLQAWLGENTAIIRCMPNTPALIRCGASALHANTFVTPEQRSLAESILRAVGITVWLDQEEQMDAVTALSGSGPAYFFLLIEMMQDIGKKMGLSAETAQLLTLQTALGATRMALETGEAAHELRHKVTSPGGTTEAALKNMEDNNIRDIFTRALLAAQKRSAELRG
jgi:pyrroline-5-carboxylate reductase